MEYERKFERNLWETNPIDHPTRPPELPSIHPCPLKLITHTWTVASIAICFPWPETFCMRSNNISTLLWKFLIMASDTSDTSEDSPLT